MGVGQLFAISGKLVSIGLGTFIMLIMPYYTLPFLPIILSPILILNSNLEPKEKRFYSLYPLILFIVVLIFHHKSSTPRSIIFTQKGFNHIFYNIDDAPKIKNKNGFRQIHYSNSNIFETKSDQNDIIPISEDQYFYKPSTKLIPVFLYDDKFTWNFRDTQLYIFYELYKFDSAKCFFQNENIKDEAFFIGTINDWDKRDSMCYKEINDKKLNLYFKFKCKNQFSSNNKYNQ
ncbi:MAG TPA: hypothetical protein VK590_13545 [Saprospiraceae bacterium]|nr:hypothetical protein [Saprospiraceae bacterium]